MDRLIPPDPDTPGGKDTGCAVFIDRQLAGALGRPLQRSANIVCKRWTIRPKRFRLKPA